MIQIYTLYPDLWIALITKDKLQIDKLNNNQLYCFYDIQGISKKIF
jgi:hypothetical protein